MSLEDRINRLVGSSLWPDQFLNGYGQGKIESARLAAEADELMREMAEHILELIDAIETDDIVYESIVERHLARETLDKYNNWKEQTNER